jgi:hypothetical protein
MDDRDRAIGAKIDRARVALAWPDVPSRILSAPGPWLPVRAT